MNDADQTIENGTNWRSLIPIKFLYVNSGNKDNIEKKYGKKYEEINLETDKIEDIDLIISLAGIKHLLKLRGYKELDYEIHSANEQYAAVKCKIRFSGHAETNDGDRWFADCACAHLGNSKGFGQQYLLELACNRAFCRTVRNFLNIYIVSKEEISQVAEEPAPNQSQSAIGIFETLLKDKGISFDRVLKRLKEENYVGVENISKISDIPKSKMLDLIEKLKKVKSVTQE